MSDLKTRHSKFMSWALRHKPKEAGITIDEQGWATIEDLRLAIENKSGYMCPRGLIEEIVSESDKQRFIISGDKIRANQGHSVGVDLGLQPTTPPAILYHGTKEEFLPSILEKGLHKRSRHHVHLSPDIETAKIVAGRRKGESVILEIHTEGMTQDFFVSDNGVWLTDHVSPEHLKISHL